MKMILKSPAFWAGLAGAAALWTFCWPGHPSGPQPVGPVKSPAKPVPWSLEQISDHITDANAAKTNEEKYQTALKLSGIPINQVREALEAIEVKKFMLSQAERILLIRWASKDGEAAADWAWRRYGKAGMWHIVFPEIGPAWAWQAPEGFANWVKKHMAPEGSPGDGKVKMASETPIVDISGFCKACRWLGPIDPHAAFDLVASRPNLTAMDLCEIANTLHSVDQVREGLLPFKELGQLDTSKFSVPQMVPMSLLARWQDLDPGDFARSPYGHLLASSAFGGVDPMIKEWKSTPSRDQRTAIAARFVDARPETQRSHAISVMAGEWVETDPAGAARWLESLPPTDDEAKISAFIHEIAPHDFDTALRFLEKQPPRVFQTALIRSFDRWLSVHPHEAPDLSRLDDRHRRIWEDLKALADQ